MKARLAIVVAAMAALTLHAQAAQPGYMQFKRQKYCSWRGENDLDLMIRGCLDAINTGMLPQSGLAGAWTDLAYAYLKKRDYESALAAADKAIAADQKEWQAFINRGAIYQHLQKQDLAEADFEMAVQLAPDEPETWLARGEFENSGGELDLAIADYTKVISLDDKNAKAYGHRARAYEAQGKSDLAAVDRVQLRKYDPDDALHLMPNP